MQLSTSITINAPKEAVWKVMTDIEKSPNTIQGIKNVEVLEQPESGVVGLKWEETRIMYGKEATEIMWITEAEENSYYKTRAENHGMVYETELRLTEEGSRTKLTMTFNGTAQKLVAKIIGGLMMPMIKKGMIKALNQDLQDIKKVAEEK